MRRLSDYFTYRITPTVNGPKVARAPVNASMPATGGVLFLNFRTTGRRQPAGDTFTLKER